VVSSDSQIICPHQRTLRTLATAGLARSTGGRLLLEQAVEGGAGSVGGAQGLGKPPERGQKMPDTACRFLFAPKAFALQQDEYTMGCVPLASGLAKCSEIRTPRFHLFNDIRDFQTKHPRGTFPQVFNRSRKRAAVNSLIMN
jgi:hypothetical protein